MAAVTYKEKPGKMLGGKGVISWNVYPKRSSAPETSGSEPVPEHLKPYDMKGQPLDFQNLPFDPMVEAAKASFLAQGKTMPEASQQCSGDNELRRGTYTATAVKFKEKPGQMLGGKGVISWNVYRKKPSAPATDTSTAEDQVPEHLKPYDMKGQPLDLQNLPFDPAVEAMKEAELYLYRNKKGPERD